MKETNNFFKQFVYNIAGAPSTLKHIAKYDIVKAFKGLIKKLKTQNIIDTQIIGIILRVKFKDGSIRSISTYRKGTINEKIKFSTLFKYLLLLRSEDYDGEEHRVIEIIFSYHIYPLDYVYDPSKDELSFNKDFLKTEDKHIVDHKTDKETNIKYMKPLGVFKLPLSFAGSDLFHKQILELNTNLSEETITDDNRIKYKIIYNKINSIEVSISVILQDDPSIILFMFIDKLITVPKLTETEILVERRVISRIKEVYLIDLINPQILLVKTLDVNQRGSKTFIKPSLNNMKDNISSMKKYITIDIEARNNMDILKDIGDLTNFTPIVIAGYVPLEGRTFHKKLSPTSEKNFHYNMESFFSNIFIYKYHKYRVYAHNLSGFDIIFIYKSLLKLGEKHDIKVEPVYKDDKIIMIKCSYGRYLNTNNFRYYVEFHDSYLKLPNSLEILSKSFITDPKFHKMDNTKMINYLLSEYVRNRSDEDAMKGMEERIIDYCIHDCKCLSEVLHHFSKHIYETFNINIHTCPTLSSIAFNIYLRNYLPTPLTSLEKDSKDISCIPLISGQIYKDIKNAYHGGHTDVYDMYSNEEVHSYDYTSMYPTQMVKWEMPVGKVTKFVGNPLTDATFESLCKQHYFIKCSVYVDKTLNRPLYQTLAKINGSIRSVCATGTFLNQWIYLPEICKYYELTNGKIRIIPESIQKGYLFESKNIFKDYINDMFKIKQSVDKSNPMYLISKLLMNSLYGRFGLKQEVSLYSYLYPHEIEKLSMKSYINIKDIIEFYDLEKSLLITTKGADEAFLKSSIPIAAAITARARMELSELLIDENLDILYIDTDSFKCKQKITELEKYKYLDHNELGALKYEGTFKESIFLLPKVYGGIYKESGEELVKVKGFKDKVEFDQLKELLFKNQSLKLTHDKWYRDIMKSEIKIMRSSYELTLNDNKRILDLKTFKTRPYHFDNYDPEKD